jgi:hypothetical protein
MLRHLFHILKSACDKPLGERLAGAHLQTNQEANLNNHPLNIGSYGGLESLHLGNRGALQAGAAQ